MKKQQILEKLERTWNDFQQSFSGLPDDLLSQPGANGDWSVKDLMAHVAWWEEETLKHLPDVAQGKRLPRYADLYGGLDAFNRLMWEKWRRASLAEVRQYMLDTHRRLLEYIQAAPDELLQTDTRFRHRLRLDTYSHYPEHTRMALAWRERAGLD